MVAVRILFILPSCGEINLHNSGKIYSTIYAPDANIILDNSSEVHGAVVGKSYVQKNSGMLHYDASLRETETGDIGAEFVSSFWSK
jgi:hypothetical protein